MRRRVVVLVGIVAALGLAGCSTSSGDDAKPEPTEITAPATKAEDAVAQQNQQLQEMEQRTSQADPTVP